MSLVPSLSDEGASAAATSSSDSNRNRVHSVHSNGSSVDLANGSMESNPLSILGDEGVVEDEEENSLICEDSSSKTEQLFVVNSNTSNQPQTFNVVTNEKSFLGTFGSLGEDGDSSATASIAAVDTIKIISWTETLATPASLGAAIFGPSPSTQQTTTTNATSTTAMMDPGHNKLESRHGLGLQIAVDRAQHVNKYNRKCVSLLLEVTTAYDHYASQLIKAGQALQPAIHIVQQQQQQASRLAATSGGISSFTPPRILSLQESMVSWSGEVSKLSAVLRTVIAQPLQAFLATAHIDATTAVLGRYISSRQQCVALRQRTVAVRNRYQRLLREAESIMAEESKKQQQPPIKLSWSDEERENQTTTTNVAATSTTTATTSTTTSSQQPPQAAAPSKRLVGKLRDVRRIEAKYKRFMQWEADCVKTSQRLEFMALETLQNMEEDRLYLFVWSLLKTLATCKQALDKLVLAMQEQQEQHQQENQGAAVSNHHPEASPEPSSPSRATSGSTVVGGATGSSTFDTGLAAGETRNRTMSFVKRITMSGGHGQGVGSGGGGGGGSFMEPDDTAAGGGCMDAETLGLPEEIGKLRDVTRAKLTTRRERVQVAKIVSSFLDTVAKASTRLGNALKHHHHRKESGGGGSSSNVINSTTVPVAADATCSGEGTRVVCLWNGVLSFIETEADGSLALAESLRGLRGEKLDALVADKERAVKAAFDADDANWKQLCDAARAHLRAENRYRQSSAESAKARVRMNSFDNEKNKQQPNNLKVGKHVSKGLANMFSILPDGGEAMRSILPPGARASVAQLSLEEADQKEAKERMQFDETLEVKSLATTAYRSNAESLIAQCDEEAKSGLDHCCCVVDSAIQSLQSLLTNRLVSLDRVKATIGESSKDYYFTDMNEWTASAQKELDSLLADKQASKTSSNGPDSLQRPAWLSAEMVRNNLEEEELLQEDFSTNDDDIDEDDMDMSNRDDDDMPPSTEWSLTQETNDPFDVQKLFSSFAQPQSPLGFRKMGGVKKLLRRKAQSHDDPETAILLDYFWPDIIDVKNVTAVVGSFACSFRSASERYPIHYGRVYLSPSRIIFTSWTKKKLNHTWQEVIDVKTSVGLSRRVEDTLVVTYQNKDSVSMVLGGISSRQVAFDLVEKLREDSKSLTGVAAAAPGPSPSGPSPSSTVTVAGGPSTGDVIRVVPPDGTLHKMEICVSKHLRKTSIQRYWELIWSDKQEPFYEKWLAKASMDIAMQPWKEGEFVGPWDKEKYGSERVVRFRVRRKTHLYIGPPIANVVQTHRCRVEGNDRCVLSMTVEFEGIPYADTFAVEIRWVASREGVEDIKMECGVFVDFKKSTFLKKQIQSGTIEESMPAHNSLFSTIQAACVADGGEEAPEEEEKAGVAAVVETEVKDKTGILGTLPCDIEGNSLYIAAVGGLVFLILLWRSLRSGSTAVYGDFALLNQRVALLEDKIDAMQVSMNEILALLRQQRA